MFKKTTVPYSTAMVVSNVKIFCLHVRTVPIIKNQMCYHVPDTYNHRYVLAVSCLRKNLFDTKKSNTQKHTSNDSIILRMNSIYRNQ